MDHKLKLQLARISLESETAGFAKLSTDVAGLLQQFVGNVKNFMTDLLVPMQNDVKFDFVPDSKLNNVIDAVNFVSISPLLISIPPGVSVKMHTFIDALEQSQSIADRLVVDTLKPALVYFSHLLAMPESLSNVAPTPEALRIKMHTTEIEAAKKATGNCYSTTYTNTRRSMGDLFDNRKDWRECNNRMQALCERLAKNPPTAIVADVNQLTEVMDRLIIRMKQKPDEYSVTGSTSDLMSKIAFEVGQEVEFYAAYSYMLQSAMSAMKDNIKQLKQTLIA